MLNNLGLGMMINIAGNARRELAGITAGFQGMQQAVDRANVDTSSFSRIFQGVMRSDQMRQIGTATGVAMVGFGTVAAGAAVVATNAFGDFQQQMLNVRAAAGIGQEAYDELSAFAIQLGADTKFSASQAANALYEISSAGFSGTQELKTLTGGSAALAAALGTDLPYAAGTLTSTMKAFQIETGKASNVADVLAKSTALSAMKGDDLQLAFGQVAGVANMVGQTLEQTTTGMMALSNAGIGASDGATSLKTAMMMLVNPGTEAQGILDQFGISIRDAQGNMKGWPDVVGEFENAFGSTGEMMKKFQGAAGMTQSELEKFATANHMTTTQVGQFIEKSFQGEQALKEYAMATVLGQDGIRAMATGLTASTDTMVDGQKVTLTGADALREWEKQLTNSGGTAQEMADIMNSGINAKLENMKGAAESASINLGQRLEPAMGGVYGAIGNLFNAFNNLSPGMQSFIAYALIAASVIGILGGATLIFLMKLPDIVAGAKLARQGITLLSTSMRGLGTRFMTGVRAIALHTAAIARNGAMALINGARWLANLAIMGVVRGATLAWTAAQWLLNVALNANPLALIVIGIAALVAAFIWAWNNVDWFRNMLMIAWNGIVAGFKWLWGLVEWYFGLWIGAFKWVAEQAVWLGGAIVDGVSGVLTWFKEMPGKIWGFLAELPAQAMEFGRNFVHMIGDGIEAGIDYVKGKVSNVASGIKDFLGFGSPTKRGPGATSDRWMPNMIGMVADGLDAGAKVVGMSASRVAQAAADGIQSEQPRITPIPGNPGPGGSGQGLPGSPQRARPEITPQSPAAAAAAATAAAVAGTAAQTQGAPGSKTAAAAQIIQLVVDGRVLAELLAAIQGEDRDRAPAF